MVHAPKVSATAIKISNVIKSMATFFSFKLKSSNCFWALPEILLACHLKEILKNREKGALRFVEAP